MDLMMKIFMDSYVKLRKTLRASTGGVAQEKRLTEEFAALLRSKAMRTDSEVLVELTNLRK
jgi:hypothetical protein